MHRKQRSCEAGNTACMGKIYRESRGYPSYTGKQRDLSETKRNDRTNLWNSERTSWFSMYSVHRKSADENESRAYFCMHKPEKLAKILVMRNRKSLSFIYRIEFLLNKINAREKWVPGLTVKHHFVLQSEMGNPFQDCPFSILLCVFFTCTDFLHQMM